MDINKMHLTVQLLLNVEKIKEHEDLSLHEEAELKSVLGFFPSHPNHWLHLYHSSWASSECKNDWVIT